MNHHRHKEGVHTTIQGRRSSVHTAEIRQVQNVALADATAKAGVSPWTKAMFKLYLCLFIATLNSCINGYDGSLMGAINEYEQYRTYFGFDLNVGTPATGIVYAIYTIGNLVGSFVAGPATDFRGRKWGMFIGCSIIMIGTCVQATCTNLGGFMGGRFVLGFGVAITSTAGPAYVSEMAHPVYRGVCTGVFNTFWYVGGIPGSFVPFGTQNIAGSQSWRIPLWLQMVFAGTVLVCSPFLPETPRWLIANDRHEEALDTMAKFHGEGSRHSPIVMLEYKEMVEDISVTGSDKRWWDYRVRT
jgi:MFS family permease